MKRITILLLLVSTTACATRRQSRIDPAGPYPDVRTGNVLREETQNGVLVVHTSRVRVGQDGRLYDLPHDLDWDSSHSVPTGYAIYDQSGRFLREVPNHSPVVVSDEAPTDVALPAGRYLVRLDRSESGVRTFWVTIESRRRTEVDPARLVPVLPDRGEDPVHRPAKEAPEDLLPNPRYLWIYTPIVRKDSSGESRHSLPGAEVAAQGA